jgi:predicted RNA-binding protein with PIN domain
MIMIIRVDGYNLLKHIFHKVKGKLDKQRQQLIRELGFYKKKKSKIKEIVLVFDGGREARATREIRSGITVVFSGQNESADDWIAEYVDRHRDQEIILITRDRELIARCQGERVEPLNVVAFYDIVQSELLEEIGQEMVARRSGEVEKYKDKTVLPLEIDSEALDIFMEHAPVGEYEKEDVYRDDKRKKGRSRTPSKKEKKLISKLKKL